MSRLYAGIAVVFIVGLLGGIGYFVWFGNQGDRFAACRGGDIVTGHATLGGPFTLVDENGRTVTDKQVITKPSLIYFGYTFCPDVCPVDNARNAAAVDILTKRGLDVQPVFITVDPKRDTPKVLRQFTENFSSKMVGLTGTEAQVDKVAKEYRVYFKVADPTQKYYLINHSTFTYLVMPKFGFVSVFRRDLSPEQLADRVACFVKAS